MLDADGVVLGSFPDGSEAFLRDDDRRRHVYLIGKTRSGKSTAMSAMMLSDLERGRGFALLDPAGDLAHRIADSVPPSEINRTIFLDPSDPQYSLGFNPLHNVPPQQRALVAAHVVAAFADIWGLSLADTPRLIYVLNNGLRLLLDTPGSTLVGLQRLIVDLPYRTSLLKRCHDPVVRTFWLQEVESYHERFATEAFAPLQNKLGLLLSDPSIRCMLAQPRSSIDFRRLMDDGMAFIVNLSKRNLGEGPTHLLGALLTTAFAQAAQSRPEGERRDFTLYTDEFQNFSTPIFADILSEASKFGLSLVLAHQFLGQLPPLLRQAVFGNVGTLLVFRIGAEDVPLLNDELGIESKCTLTDTAAHTAWLKMSPAGVPREPRPVAIDFPQPVLVGQLLSVVNNSRACYLRPRARLEEKITRFLAPPGQQRRPCT